jgi:hypothetical protein
MPSQITFLISKCDLSRAGNSHLIDSFSESDFQILMLSGIEFEGVAVEDNHGVVIGAGNDRADRPP